MSRFPALYADTGGWDTSTALDHCHLAAAGACLYQLQTWPDRYEGQIPSVGVCSTAVRNEPGPFLVGSKCQRRHRHATEADASAQRPKAHTAHHRRQPHGI